MSHSSATRDNNGLLIVPALVVMLALWLGGIVHWLNTGDLLRILGPRPKQGQQANRAQCGVA